jgi:hypothetical protein
MFTGQNFGVGDYVAEVAAKELMCELREAQ